MVFRRRANKVEMEELSMCWRNFQHVDGRFKHELLLQVSTNHFTLYIDLITSTQWTSIVCTVTQFGLNDTDFADYLSQLIGIHTISYYRPHATFLSVHNERTEANALASKLRSL